MDIDKPKFMKKLAKNTNLGKIIISKEIKFFSSFFMANSPTYNWSSLAREIGFSYKSGILRTGKLSFEKCKIFCEHIHINKNLFLIGKFELNKSYWQKTFVNRNFLERFNKYKESVTQEQIDAWVGDFRENI